MMAGKNKAAGNRNQLVPQGGQTNPPGHPIFTKLKPIRSVSDAQNLLSRLISAFVKQRVIGEDLRVLVYALSTYVAIAKDASFEKRLDALENKRNIPDVNQPDYIERGDE